MSSAAKVELYVSKRPYVKEALAEGIVNYSALARKICCEESIESVEAVKAALSRYQDHVSTNRVKQREKVKQILESTSFNVRPGVKVVKEERGESLVFSRTARGYTSIVDGGESALISLESPESLEDTPGVIEFLLSSLAAEGVNVEQLISCREDTHLVVSGECASTALDLLQARLTN